MNSTIKKVFISFIVLFLIHEILIVSDGLTDVTDENTAHADIAVILGSKVNEDRSLSPRLKARLDKGLELYQNGIVDAVFVSGGLGKEGYYEGTVMAEYLHSKGIPMQNIKIDNEGINTRRTALNFLKEYSKESSVIVVSQYFHISRCKLAFKQLGIANVSGAHSEFFEWRDFYSTFREVFGYYKYLIWY